MKKEIANYDEYISLQADEAKEMLHTMRKLILELAPDATEVISYGMPAFRYANSMLVYIAGFTKHCSLFAANSKLTASMAEELKPYKTSKGTIQFQFNQKLPLALIKKIVKARMKENIEKQKIKAIKKK